MTVAPVIAHCAKSTTNSYHAGTHSCTWPLDLSNGAVTHTQVTCMFVTWAVNKPWERNHKPGLDKQTNNGENDERYQPRATIMIYYHK